jgi:hypothetical protein
MASNTAWILGLIEFSPAGIVGLTWRDAGNALVSARGEGARRY